MGTTPIPYRPDSEWNVGAESIPPEYRVTVDARQLHVHLHGQDAAARSEDDYGPFGNAFLMGLTFLFFGGLAMIFWPVTLAAATYWIVKKTHGWALLVPLALAVGILIAIVIH